MSLNGKPEVGFIVACKEFFGFKPGQTLLDFKNEVGQLTPEDRIAIRTGLVLAGINVKPL